MVVLKLQIYNEVMSMIKKNKTVKFSRVLLVIIINRTYHWEDILNQKTVMKDSKFSTPLS